MQKAWYTELKEALKPPQVHYEAEDNIDLIDWQSTIITEPSLIINLSKQETELIVASGTSNRNELQKIIHTHAV